MSEEKVMFEEKAMPEERAMPEEGAMPEERVGVEPLKDDEAQEVVGGFGIVAALGVAAYMTLRD